MSRIWSMMDVGKRSMMNSQTALQTVSHNIANKSTEGYSRQRVDVKTNEPVGNGNIRIGMGARPGTVSRVNNPYLERQLEKEGAQLSYLQARTDMLDRVEQVYNEQVNKGLNQFLGEFFNSFRELANNPESLATRTLVKESAEFLTRDFGRVHNQLSEVQNDADFRIEAKVAEVNEITKEIAQLNEKIQAVEIQGTSANDERDRRDQLIKNLGQKINIKYAESKEGSVTITAGQNAVIVSGFSHRDLFVAKGVADGQKREGNADIYYKATKEGTPIKLTSQITGGELGGLINVRDKIINRSLAEVNSLAFKLHQEVNLAHSQGFDQYSGRAGLFFNNLDSPEGAAEKLRVSDSILTDVGKIGAGAEPNAAGDNRIANIISSIQYKKVMNKGTNTVGDFYSSIVGQVGIETQRTRSGAESQKASLDQLKNIRESISGVSLDEETTKMIEFQKNYDASARLIRTADEMMDTVLNLKRY